MERTKQHLMAVCLIAVVLLFGFAFYWYEYRPTEIRKYCSVKAQSGIRDSLGAFMAGQYNYDDNYKRCLRDKGLEK